MASKKLHLTLGHLANTSLLFCELRVNANEHLLRTTWLLGRLGYLVRPVRNVLRIEHVTALSLHDGFRPSFL